MLTSKYFSGYPNKRLRCDNWNQKIGMPESNQNDSCGLSQIQQKRARNCSIHKQTTTPVRGKPIQCLQRKTAWVAKPNCLSVIELSPENCLQK